MYLYFCLNIDNLDLICVIIYDSLNFLFLIYCHICNRWLNHKRNRNFAVGIDVVVPAMNFQKEH